MVNYRLISLALTPCLEQDFLLAAAGEKTPLLPGYRGHPCPEKASCPLRLPLDEG